MVALNVAVADVSGQWAQPQHYTAQCHSTYRCFLPDQLSIAAGYVINNESMFEAHTLLSSSALWSSSPSTVVVAVVAVIAVVVVLVVLVVVWCRIDL